MELNCHFCPDIFFKVTSQRDLKSNSIDLWSFEKKPIFKHQRTAVTFYDSSSNCIILLLLLQFFSKTLVEKNLIPIQLEKIHRFHFLQYWLFGGHQIAYAAIRKHIPFQDTCHFRVMVSVIYSSITDNRSFTITHDIAHDFTSIDFWQRICVVVYWMHLIQDGTKKWIWENAIAPPNTFFSKSQLDFLMEISTEMRHCCPKWKLANWSNISNEIACKPLLLLNQQTIEALHTLHTFSWIYVQQIG